MFVPFEMLTDLRKGSTCWTDWVSIDGNCCFCCVSGAAAGSTVSLCWQDLTGPDNYRTNAGTLVPIVIMKWILSDSWRCSDVQCVSKCLKCL